MRVIEFKMQLTDEEFAAMAARMGERATITIDGNVSVPGSEEDDDNAPVNGAAPALDANNVPWIPEVHASSKAINNDGTWRLRKGVDKAHAATVIAAARVNAPSATLPAATQPPVVAPVTTPPVYAAPTAPVAAPVVPAAPAGLPGMPTFAPPPAPVADVPVSYDAIVAKCTELAAKGVTNEQFGQCYSAAGITDATIVMNNETARANLMAQLNALG